MRRRIKIYNFQEVRPFCNVMMRIIEYGTVGSLSAILTTNDC